MGQKKRGTLASTSANSALLLPFQPELVSVVYQPFRGVLHYLANHHLHSLADFHVLFANSDDLRGEPRALVQLDYRKDVGRFKLKADRPGGDFSERVYLSPARKLLRDNPALPPALRAQFPRGEIIRLAVLAAASREPVALRNPHPRYRKVFCWHALTPPSSLCGRPKWPRFRPRCASSPPSRPSPAA